MTRTLVSPNASNWVDKGHPPNRVMRRVLAYVLDRHAPGDEPWLDDHANVIVGMVAAEANEVEVANYVRWLRPADGDAATVPDQTRLAGIALWHVAKAALVRDVAERELQAMDRGKV